MTSLAVHSLDTFMYFGGPIRRVFAATRAPRGDRTIDQTTALTIEFESGAMGAIVTSFFVPNLVRLSVRGTAGAAFNEPVELGLNDPVEDQLTEFVMSVSSGAKPEVGGREGMAVVAVLEAAMESSQTGQTIELD